MAINEKKIRALLKSRKPIILNTSFIKNVLGYDDMRDFFSDLANWGNNTDFTYQTTQNDCNRFLRAFLKSYLD